MDEFLDTYLGKILKNWAGKHKPPVHIRGRILRLAAQPPARVKGREFLPIIEIQNYQPVNWEHYLHSCGIVHSYQNGLTVSRLLV